MIRIIESYHSLSEEELDGYQKDNGWTLISVNCVVISERLGTQSYMWTYHFRTNEEKGASPIVSWQW